MEPSTRAAGVRLDERTVRLVIGALGAGHVLVGLYQYLAPGSFFHRIGQYGVENTHYVGDIAAFVIAFGVGLLLAVGRPGWRAPLLTVGAVWYGLHAINHLLDIDEARSDARGIADTLFFAINTALLAWLASVSGRVRR